MHPARIALTVLAAVLTCCSLPCAFPPAADALIATFRAPRSTSPDAPSISREFRRMAPPVRSGPAEALWTMETGRMKPLSLASADFNGDGMPDAVIGHGDNAGNHAAEFRPGNPDALFPNARAALRHKAEGTFSAEPLLAASRLTTLPVKPDFLAAGDFDADGKPDLAVGAFGDDFFYVLAGDGTGEFEAPLRMGLAGPLTWLGAADVNRRDGFPEIIVGVTGGDGPGLLVYEGPSGAMEAKPEFIELTAEAVEVVFGDFDDDYPRDMAVLLASGEVAMVRGRDRRLSFDEDRQSDVPEPVALTLPLAPSVALASGKFLGTGRDTLASLGSDGTLTFLEPGGAGASTPTTSIMSVPAVNAASASRFKLTTLPTPGGDQVALFETERSTAPVVTASGLTRDGTGSGAPGEPLDTPARAVLPARLNADAFSDMLVLGEDAASPLGVVSSVSERVVVVTSDGCGFDVVLGDGVCADPDGECTLNAAMGEIAGASGTGTGTIRFNVPLGGVPTLCNVAATPPVAVYDGTTQAEGFVRIGGYLNFKAGTVLRGIVTADNATIKDGSIVEGCRIENELHLADNCTVGGTIEAARNIFHQFGGLAGLMIEGDNNVVQGNWFGYNPGGRDPNLPAIRIDTPSGSTSGPLNNLIGGTAAGTGNVIVAAGTSETVRIGPWTSGNRFQGNYLGTDHTGMAAAASSEQVSGITVGGIGNTVGGTAAVARNLIVGAGNGKYGTGIRVVGAPGATQGLVIQGNYVGLDKTGAGRIGTWQRGVHVGAECESIVLGGAVQGAGNVIAGSSYYGVILQGKDETTGIQGTSRDHAIQGNLIGTDATGTVSIPNRYGILITYSTANLVGGTRATTRNIISGNSADGIHILGETGGGNTITGNYIGVDATGTKALPQPGWGVYVETSPSNTIGGRTKQARNVISCNGQGNVRLQNMASTGNKILGNHLGTTANGVDHPGAAGYWGVLIAGGAHDNTIGGRQEGAGNVIAHNTESGVAIITDTSVNNAILGNSIHSIGKMGIDLGYNGVSANDYQDADVGPNNLQNAPELTAITSATNCTVNGKLHSTPSTSHRLEFFASCALNAEGLTEGRYFMGARNVTTSSMGDAAFSYAFPIPPCPLITATATDPSGNTSEFSLWVAQTTPIFREPFADADRWNVVSGTWDLASGSYVAGTAAKNVAVVKSIDPVTSPIGATRIQTSLKLAQGESNPNGGIVFGYKKPNQYRWLLAQQGKLTLGQTGTMNGTTPGALVSANVTFTPGKPYNVKLDIFNDGTVDVYVNNKKVLSGKFENGTVAGGVGIQSNKSAATFDNFTIWAPSVLPEE